MERQVLDLLFGHVFGIVGLERHAVVAHAFRTMPAHFRITGARNLPIQFVQLVIERGLLDNLPGVFDRLWSEIDRFGL